MSVQYVHSFCTRITVCIYAPCPCRPVGYVHWCRSLHGFWSSASSRRPSDLNILAILNYFLIHFPVTIDSPQSQIQYILGHTQLLSTVGLGWYPGRSQTNISQMWLG